MSLNPSNQMAALHNPGRTMFDNLAGGEHTLVDATVKRELAEAGIEAEGPCESIRSMREVPSAYVGNLCLWGFRRAWYYWMAEGPGIPADKAQAFHELWGTQVRVAGHCACPSPLEWFKGFAVGHYHIDTQEGLNAFAELLRSIFSDQPQAGA